MPIPNTLLERAEIERKDAEIVKLLAALEHIRDKIGPGHGEPRAAEYADSVLSHFNR